MKRLVRAMKRFAFVPSHQYELLSDALQEDLEEMHQGAGACGEPVPPTNRLLRDEPGLARSRSGVVGPPCRAPRLPPPRVQCGTVERDVPSFHSGQTCVQAVPRCSCDIDA